jgi:hypothetical protein
MLFYQYTLHRRRSAARQPIRDPEAAEVPRPVLGDGRKRGGTVAISKKAAPAKEAEKRKPDFVVRAKVKEDVWVTIGAAWSAQLKGGVTGYSLKINTFPAQWNGDALLMPPLETEE